MKLNRQSVVLFALSLLYGCSALQSNSDDSGLAIVEGRNAASGLNPAYQNDFESLDDSSLTLGEKTRDDLQTNNNVSPHLVYKLLVAEIAGQRGELDIAIKNYIEVAKESRDPKVAARATQIAFFAKDYDRALSASKLWVATEPENAEAQRNLASAFIKLARPNNAVVHYEKMLQLLDRNTKPGHGLSTIASQLARESDRDIAISVMERLIENRKDNPYALFAYAHLAMRQGRFEIALNALDQALEIKPNWVNVVVLRSRILAMQGARGEAITYLENILKGELSENVDIGLTHARMLTEARQLEKALGEFIRLASLAPKNAEINYYAGILALQLKRLDDAKKYLMIVLTLGKRIQETNYYLGQVGEENKDFKNAMNRYSFVRHGEFYFNAQVRIAAILADTGRFEQAREHLQTIRVASEKQKLQILLLEGDVLREAGRYPDAKDFYTKVLNIMPNETSIRYARALVAEKLGELDLVESDLQAILKQEPRNAQALNALGYTLADRTTRYEEALDYIQRALELEPDDVAVVDSLGWVYYRMGNYKKAIELLRRANEQAKDPEIAAHLGEVLWVSGERSAALKIWEASLQIHPNHEILLDVMKRFGL
ncbi:MAG: tetratricopeptide repeat protein [Gammaproteobacteria bacterium]|nr:tetratricopeptide repeat protein [Gammaproteobacteria bacterium]